LKKKKLFLIYAKYLFLSNFCTR